MEAVENSVTVRLFLPLWTLLRGYYADSALKLIFRSLSSSWNRSCDGSALVCFLRRDGAISRAWRRSAVCRILGIALNLPAALLNWIYLRLQPVFDGSLAARIVFGMGEQTPAAIGWLFLVIVLIPYKHWNNMYSLAGFFLMYLLMLAGGMRRSSLRLNVASVGPYAVCFAAAVCAAWPLSAFPDLSFRFLFFHITCMLCVIVTVSAVEHAEQLERLVSFAVLGLGIMSAAGIVQRIQGVEVNASYVDLVVNEGMPGRIYAMFENPNAFAEVLLLLIPLAVALMLGSSRWSGRIGGFFAAVLGLAAIFMTYGRASWVGLAVAALLFVLLWNRKLLPVLILLGLAVFPVLPDSVFHRILTIFNLKDTSTTSRFPLYSAAFRLLRARPLTGAGLGTDAVRQAVKDLNDYHGTAPFVHAHDVFLQIWAETGLLGLLSFLGAMFWSIKHAARAAASEGCPRPVRLITIGGASALAGILVSGIADYIWNYPRVMLIFWFIVAVTLSGIRLSTRAARS